MENPIINLLKLALDLLTLTMIIYYFFKVFVNSEKYLLVVYAVLSLIGLYIITIFLDLAATQYVLANIFSWGVVILVIIFQSEIREVLETLGGVLSGKKRIFKEDEAFVTELIETMEVLSETKTGALITLQMKNKLDDYTKNAISIDAEFSKHLLLSIFNKEVPIHDGAVIIKDGRIKYASTYFPIDIDLNISKDYGTRHRAALTISKSTDSLTLIVSEETGKVSIALRGKLYQSVSPEFVRNMLEAESKKENNEES